METWRVLAGLIILMSLGGIASGEYLESKCIYSLQDDNVDFVFASDLGGDGVVEVITGSMNGRVYDLVYDGGCDNWQFKWMRDTTGKAQDMLVADLNNDGKKEVLVAVTESRNKAALVYKVDQRGDGLLDWDQDTVTKNKESVGFSYSIHAADLDGDGVKEVVLGGKNSKVYVLDGKDNIKWEYETDFPVYFVHASDIDRDGDMEVVALARKYGIAKVYVLSSTGSLEWKYSIENGVYTTSRNNIMVEDLEGDGTKEVVVGSYSHGVDVLDSSGKLRWTQMTENGLVSALNAYDINGDGVKEVLVGSRPYLHVFNTDGSLLWRSPVNTTIHSMHVADLDGDGSKEILVGATRYIHVLDSSGSPIALWSYREEIQGLTKAYKIKDADAMSITSADFDNGGDIEVAVAFGWEEDRMDQNYYFGNVQVFEVNPEEALASPETTLNETTETTQPRGTTGPTLEQHPLDEGDSGGICCMPFLPGVVALALSLLLSIPYALSLGER